MGHAALAVDGVAGHGHGALDKVRDAPVRVAADHDVAALHAVQPHVRDGDEQALVVQQRGVHGVAVHADDLKQEAANEEHHHQRRGQGNDPLPQLLLPVLLGLLGSLLHLRHRRVHRFLHRGAGILRTGGLFLLELVVILHIHVPRFSYNVLDSANRINPG